MFATTKREDKFAFLFSGPTGARFTKDLENVFHLLTVYYNYPADQIWVVTGESDISGSFAGANYTSLHAESDPKTALNAKYGEFAVALNANIPVAEPDQPTGLNTGVVYMTGTGHPPADPMDPFALPELEVVPAGTNINAGELEMMFGSVPFSQSQLNLILQFDHADLFKDNIFGIGLSVTANKSITWVVGDQSGSGDATDGGTFTASWVRALKMGYMVNDGGPKYPDELLSPPDEELFYVSLEQAKRFVELETSLTVQYDVNGDKPFLGRPDFLIQDGGGGMPWWESPDIYLTHPNYTPNPSKKDDRYMPDTAGAVAPFNNTVNVVVRNLGTHPVRKYRLGICIYETPFGPPLHTIDENCLSPDVNSEGLPVLLPTVQDAYESFAAANMDIYTWNTAFYEGTTHSCIVATAETAVLDPTLYPIDVYATQVTALDNKAQRNTDQSTDPPKVEGKRIPGDSFRGRTKHVYTIKNPFMECYEYLLIRTREYEHSLKYADVSWYTFKDGKWKPLEFRKQDDSYYVAAFNLCEDEQVTLMADYGLKEKLEGKTVRLPLEIALNKVEGNGTRWPESKALHGKYGSIAGISILLDYAPSDVVIRVTDRKEKPLSHAVVEMATVNGLAREKLETDREGRIILKAINPDIYRLHARCKGYDPVQEQLVAEGGKQEVHLSLAPAK